jgi:hypothetical protein
MAPVTRETVTEYDMQRRATKRDLFAEIKEGFAALADERAGKRKLRTRAATAKPSKLRHSNESR